MRNTIVRPPDRTNQTGGCAELRRRDRTVTSINHRLIIGVTTVALRCHLFVERMIKQHNFPVYFLARQRFQFLKVAHTDGIGIDSLGRSGDASAESAEDYFLRGPGSLSGKLRELCCFRTAYPMGHHHFFQLHLAAKRFHFAGHVFDRLRRLSRARQSRPDVVRQMCNLFERIITRQCCLSQLLQISKRLFRENNRRRTRTGRRH